MRLREMAGKEVINLKDGTRLGAFGDADFLLELESGRIQAVFLSAGSFGNRKKRLYRLNWRDVLKVGPDLVIVNAAEDNTGGEGKAAEGKAGRLI